MNILGMKRKAANKLGKRILTNLFATEQRNDAGATVFVAREAAEAVPAESVRLKRNEKAIGSLLIV